MVRVNVGLHPETSPGVAREEALKVLADIAKGINPNKEKNNSKIAGYKIK